MYKNNLKSIRRSPFSLRNSKGISFTEIMMVVTVLIILGAIILVVGNKVWVEGRDARIKSDLLELQSQAENIFLDEGNYNIVCCEDGCDAKIKSLCDDIDKNGGGTTIYQYKLGGVGSPISRYCVASDLNSHIDSRVVSFCADYVGNWSVGWCSKLHICSPCHFDFNDDKIITIASDDPPCNGSCMFAPWDPCSDQDVCILGCCIGWPIEGGDWETRDCGPYPCQIWGPVLDLNEDGKVNVLDESMLQGQIGLECF